MNKDELQNEIIEDMGQEVHNGQLPQFLNVLTILTFIWSGLSVLMALYNFTTIDEQERNIALLKSMPEANILGADFVASAQLALDNIFLLQGTAIVVALLCLFSAALMRKLKKTGFHLYLLASVASVAIPLLILGFGTMGLIILLGSIFTIAFIIMYGVNYKYLR